MKTLVAIVSIGSRTKTFALSVPRARLYAARHGYDFTLITEALRPESGRTPHWDKLLVPQAFPGYDRYLLVDDDVLINHRLAPPLPDVPEGLIGIVKEPLPTRFDPPMEFLGNSGVLLVDAAAVDLLDRAYKMGVVKGKIPGIAEQPALNITGWNTGRFVRLDWRWNYLVMNDWLRTAHHQVYPWTSNLTKARIAKLTLLISLTWSKLCSLSGIPNRNASMERLKGSYFVHLVWFRIGARWIDWHLG